MAGLDGTGPLGLGPATGRGYGPCCGNSPGLGWKRFGFGRRFGFNWSKSDQLKTIAEMKNALEEDLKALEEEEKRIKDEK